MTTKEQIVVFRGTEPLSGIICSPSDGEIPGLNMVLVNSGIVHRIGANRITVEIARQGALNGTQSLRFDISGIGETAARTGATPWEVASVEDIGAAISFLKESQPDVPVGLFGNCGGAAKSFWSALARPEVASLILTNPPPLIGYAPASPTPPPGLEQLVADFQRLLDRGTQIRIVFAQGDIGESFYDDFLKELLQIYQTKNLLRVTRIPNSNHTFAPVRAKRQLRETVVRWMREFAR